MWGKIITTKIGRHSVVEIELKFKLRWQKRTKVIFDQRLYHNAAEMGLVNTIIPLFSHIPNIRIGFILYISVNM